MDLLIRGIAPGCQFKVVAHVVGSLQGALQCCGVSPAQHFQIVDAPDLDKGKYTFYGLVKAEEDTDLCKFVSSTEALSHPNKGDFRSMSILDLCSGIGGFSIGSQVLGLKTEAFVERNQLACTALRANFDGIVYQGDLEDDEILKQIHRQLQGAFLEITGGFPCQGFSRQGDMHGLEDHRSHGLHYILEYAWYLQADVVLLECVDNVIQFPQTQAYIDKYAQDASMSCHKMVFDLQHQWPVKRNRFWCYMLHQDIQAPSIQPWPKTTDYQRLQDVMPLDAIWSPEEEQQLEWDASEVAIYMDPAYGHDQRVLQPGDKAPTMLHSRAHVNRPCPCGCRAAFSDRRLRQGGARGFGLLSACTGKCRHLHPAEGALLCTVPPSFIFPMPPRSALSLLGQIAAPLQVLWLQSHLLANLQYQTWGWTGIDPSMCIKAYQQYLTMHSFRQWVTPQMYLPRTISLCVEDEETVLQVTINKPTTVRDLAMAEKNLCGWGHFAVVKHQGSRVPLAALLHTDLQYTIALCKSAQAKPFPMEDITGGGHDEGHGLGDKIIWSYMRAMVADLDESPCPLKPWITYPFRVDQFLQTSLPDDLCSTWKASYQRSSGSIYVICEYHGHWFLLVGCCNELKDGIYWTLHDGLRQGHQLTTFSLVAKKLSGILDLDFVDLHMGNGLLQAHPSTCGTVALVQMALDLRLTAPETDWNLLPLHQWLLSHQPASCIIARGPGLPAELQTKLTTLLQQHGVPATEVSERTKLVTQKLGVAAIQEAFAAKNCWAYLKAIASRPSISLRLVLPDELSKHVAATSTTRFGAHVANAKGKKKQKPDHKATPANIILDPEQLVLTHTSFRDPDDDVVQQIPFSAVEAEATGIAICNLAQGCHFIQTKQSISSKPLAILLTEQPPQAFMDEHDVRAISFAAKYTGTGEPVLVFGALKNLGDIKINQHVPGIHEQPALVDTQVIKVQVFRDEFSGSWQQLAQSPVRTLCQAVPRLQLCQGKGCGHDCTKSHPAVDEELDTILLEIWSRSFTKLEGGKIPAADAQIFGVFLRIPASILDALLQLATPGIYFEPRSTKTKGHDERYRVIWLSARSFDEAAHTCRTHVHALGLVRMKKKYGIRVLAEHEEQTFRQIKPDATWVNTQVQRIFQLFPLPHGLQRGGVIKLLKDIDWAVKPLQPGKGNAEAMSWQVGASTSPPQEVITAFGREILITEITREDKPVPQPTLVASARTQQHLRSAPSAAASTIDPWSLPGMDPWKPATNAKPAASGKSHLQTMAGNLKDELTAAMEQKFEELQQCSGHMDSDSIDEHQADNLKRFTKIENSLGELQAQQLQFSGWFSSLGQQVQAAETSIQTIQYTLNTHQTELQGLHHEIKGVSEQVGQAVHNALQSHKNEVAHDLDSRFDRLEALFSNKKQRNE